MNVVWRPNWPFVVVLPIAGMGAVLAYGTLVERHHLRVRQVAICIAGLPPEFDGYRIVQLSDFHMGGNGWSARTAARAVELALSQHGDLIVLTGDFVETTPGVAACAELLAPLHAPDGILAVLGNHDYADCSVRIQALIGALQDVGATVLRNGSHVVRRNGVELWFVGVDDAYSGHDFLPKAIEGVPHGARPIVLSHYPDFAKRLGPGRWALVISGHTHGSQVRLPILGRLLRERIAKTRFSGGMYRVNRIPLFITTGVGTSGRPLRLLARPEVVAITLHAAPAPVATK